MAGLIDSQLEKDPNAATAAASNGSTPATDLSKGAGYTPAQVDLNPATDTVEGRVQSLIAKNSAPMQSAATRGLASAQSRGLINSSIAVGESQRALYDYATPIAQADAQNSLAVKTGNVNAQNTASGQQTTGTQALQQIQANVGGQSQLQAEKGIIESQQITQQGSVASQLQAEKGQIDLALQTASGQQAIDLQARKAEIDKQLAAQGGDIQATLMDQKAAIDLKLQSASAADAATLQAQKGQIDQQLAQIQIQADTAKIAQQGQIDQQLTAQKGEIDKQLQTADAASKAALTAQQGAIDMQLATLRGDQTISLTRLQGQIDTQLQQLRGTQAVELTAAQAEQEKGLIAARAAADAQLETLKGQLQTQLQTLQGTQAVDLANIEGTYKTILQTSQSASVFYSQISASIGEILANGDIKIDQKQALVNQQLSLLNNGLAVIGGVTNMDLGGLIDTSAPGATIPPGGVYDNTNATNPNLAKLGGVIGRLT